MQNKKTITYEQNNTIVDGNSGEIVKQQSFSQSVVEREPDYVKLYITDIIRLNDLPKNSDRVLHILLKNMSYSNVIAVYMPIKKMICAELGMGMESVNKAIKNLYACGILIRVDRGLYMADPALFGKGKWQDIKGLRLIVEYAEDGGKQITGERVSQLKLL